jgi:uncharacterized protein (UPF0261 family)
MPTVLLMTSFDTRKEEALLLKNLIEKEGCSVLTLDVSSGTCRKGVADYSCHDVPAELGLKFEAFSSTRDTYLTMEYVIQGGLGIAKKLFREGKIDGLAGIGGTSNTTIVSLIMKEFPFGFPKMILTSSAAIPAYSSKFFADTDITIFHSCVEINTLNVFVQDVLLRFAGIVAGVLRVKRKDIIMERPAVAVSEFKFSEKCAVKVREVLEARGYQAVPFSATGPGERIMERMVEEGHFKGVIDLVPAGLSEALLGGNRASGLDRLDKELASGIPVILTPSGFEMLSCGPLDRKDSDLWWKRKRIAERKLFIPDKYRVQARTTKREMTTIAKLFGEKLNRAAGSVTVFIPSKGFSSLSKEGGPLYEPETDAVFLKVLRKVCDANKVDIISMDCNLDDPLFAEAIVDHFFKVIGGLCGGDLF